MRILVVLCDFDGLRFGFRLVLGCDCVLVSVFGWSCGDCDFWFVLLSLFILLMGFGGWCVLCWWFCFELVARWFILVAGRWLVGVGMLNVWLLGGFVAYSGVWVELVAGSLLWLVFAGCCWLAAYCGFWLRVPLGLGC